MGIRDREMTKAGWITWGFGTLTGLIGGGGLLYAVVVWHVDLANDVVQLRKDATFQYLEVVITDREDKLVALEKRQMEGEVLTGSEIRQMGSFAQAIARMTERRNKLIGIVDTQ